MSPGILCMCQRSSQHRGRQDHTFLKINAHTYFFVFKGCNIFRGNTFYMIFRLVLQEAFSIQLYSIAYPRSKLPAVWNSFYFWLVLLYFLKYCLVCWFFFYSVYTFADRFSDDEDDDDRTDNGTNCPSGLRMPKS